MVNSNLHERYHSRKQRYTDKVLGELEAFVECPMNEWSEPQFDRAFDLLSVVDQEIQASLDYMDKKVVEDVPEPETRKCILCGKDTEGSIGRAGIKWAMICQPCKDMEDEALLRQVERSVLPLKKLIDGIDNFASWLAKEEGEKDV